MSLEVYFRPDAEVDISEAADWYESQRSGLGEQFLDEVLIACQSISENPEIYPTVHRDCHRTITHKFPFGVFYKIEKNWVIVFAVIHASRDPKNWKRRS